MTMYSFKVQRTNDRRSSSDKLEAQLNKMAKAATRGVRGSIQGWHMTNKIIAPEPVWTGDSYEYSFVFNFRPKPKMETSEEVHIKQFESLMDMAQLAGNISKWDITEFSVDSGTDACYKAPTPILPAKAIEPEIIQAETECPVDYSNDLINLDPTGYFTHLYDREDQIDVLISGVRTAIDSDFAIRNHCLIEGDPCGGKTTLARAFKAMVGEDFCHYIDMTTSTQAGILLGLMEVSDSVKFIIIEELEKVDPKDLRWLLGVMDERGEINICNAKVGNLRRKMPAYIIATVNDTKKFETFQSGALASRFGDRVYCPILSRETIFKAVKQAVDKINGDDRWIDPAIDYCQKFEQGSDIRRIKSVALGGRDRLLTGEYQRILRATCRPGKK